MKRLCKVIVMLAFFLGISGLGLKWYTYNNTSTIAAIIDRFNPLVRADILYVKTTENYDYKYPDSVSKIENFAYVQTGYNADGKGRKIEYISFNKQLAANRFLKVTTKGQSVQNWEEIEERAVPATILRLLL